MESVRRYGLRLKSNFSLHEISGSLGDLGTLLPIMISLSIANQINLTSTLWFTGIWNILSGMFFQAPVCVQPMKAIAAIVLTKNMTIQENMGAGLGVSALIFFLGFTRTIHLVGTFTPSAVIKGLQLGTAVQLIIKAHNLVASLKWQITASNWADNNTWVLLSFMFVVLCYQTRVPSALILFLIGLLFALILLFGTNNSTPRPSVIGGHYPNTIIVPSAEEFKTGFLNAGLGQLPLTALNSVIALCALIDDLFPDRHATTSNVAMSVGLMNLIGCWFGSMPVCHGSGGLAGQYRFGARSELSVILLGVCKLLLGILFGSSVVGLLQLFPKSILAVMMFISGVELGSAAKSVNDHEPDENRKKENFTIMLLTAGSLIAYSHDGIGFLAGLTSAFLLAFQRLGPKACLNSVLKSVYSIPQKWKDQSIPTSSQQLPTSSSSVDEQEERIHIPASKGLGNTPHHI
ncbi:hypothetical protein BY458DRAFT_587835 [Sporodiniella umbellata]|nr:hypothetical protein BY458DRAFT_587835 [Sporodiniella umbellata]